MLDPEQDFEYENKCERIATQIEMLILDGIIAALARVKYYLQEDERQPKIPPDDAKPF